MSKFNSNKLCCDCPDCVTLIMQNALGEDISEPIPYGWCAAFKVRTSEDSSCGDIYNKYKGIDG